MAPGTGLASPSACTRNAGGASHEHAHHRSSQPWLHQKGEFIQEFATVKQFPIELSYGARVYA